VGTRDEPLRSPHNSPLTFLARSGVPGFALWVLLQTFWAGAMLSSYIKASQRQMALWSAFFSWLVAYWLAFMVSASFDVFLEGPMAGIPFWSLFGMGWGAHMLFRTYLKQQQENCRVEASGV
jgi:O-antigen ligase